MLGLLTPHQIEDVLQKELIGRIGCHADLITYVVPVTYVYDEDCIYAHSAEGTKLEMMRKNPSVCFEVDHMHSMVDWQSVIAWGEYEEIINETERSTAISLNPYSQAKQHCQCMRIWLKTIRLQ